MLDSAQRETTKATKVTELRRKDITQAQLPPQNIEIELEILGGILIDPEAMGRVIDTLSAEMFYTRSHQIIYDAAVWLHQRNRPTDLSMMALRLTEKGQIDQIGGIQSLVKLAEVVNAVNIDLYASVIREKWERRTLIRTLHESVEQCYGSEEWDTIRSDIEKKIFSVTVQTGRGQHQDPGAGYTNLIEELEALQDGRKAPGTPLGFRDLDGILDGGIRPGELITIAGLSGSGKSALAGNMAYNLAAHSSISVHSLEMPDLQWRRRLLSCVSEVPISVLKRGQFANSDQQAHVYSCLYGLINRPILVNDDAAVTVDQIYSQTRKLIAQQQRQSPLAAVVVDHLHMMAEVRASDQQHVAIGRITGTLKAMAKDLGVTVILLAQLNRGLSARKDKRPIESDLLGSGAIRQDSDVVLFVHREEQHDPETPDRGLAEVIVNKNRDGATGTVRMLFEGHLARFRDLAVSAGN